MAGHDEGARLDEVAEDPFDRLSDVDLINAFVLAVLDDVEALVELREVLFLVAPNRTDPDAIRFCRELEGLKEELRGRFEATNPSLAAAAGHVQALASHGLTAHALRAKLAAWRRERAQARQKFADSKDEAPRAPRRLWETDPPPPFADLADVFGPPIPMKVPRKPGPALRAVARMSGPAATILGSLSDVVPGLSFLSEGVGVIGQVSGDIAADLGA